MKRAFIVFVIITLLFAIPRPVLAAEMQSGDVSAGAAILVDVNTGKILYAKNEHEPMYPASITKILTAAVALEYLDPEEILICGNEVNSIPFDSSRAYLVVGEALSVENAIRGLIIPSGNETACVVALAVARRAAKDPEMGYVAAERYFCNLMNERAKALGCTNTNFVNPHGYHNPNHITSAADIAIFSEYAMQNELIRSIAKEASYIGPSAPYLPDPSAKLVEHTWKSHNLILPGFQYEYPYATGIKTGNTEMGTTLAASAEKDGRELIAVVLGSTDPERWFDTIKLFNYGFDNFRVQTVQEKGVLKDTIKLYNVPLGVKDTMDVHSNVHYEGLFSDDQMMRITSTTKYNEELLAVYTEEDRNKPDFKDEMRFITPMEAGAVIAEVSYFLDGELLFKDTLLAEESVATRTFNTDVDYYGAKVKGFLTSTAAIPYYVIVVLLIVIIVMVILRVRSNNSWKSQRTGRKRY